MPEPPGTSREAGILFSTSGKKYRTAILDHKEVTLDWQGFSRPIRKKKAGSRSRRTCYSLKPEGMTGGF